MNKGLTVWLFFICYYKNKDPFREQLNILGYKHFYYAFQTEVAAKCIAIHQPTKQRTLYVDIVCVTPSSHLPENDTFMSSYSQIHLDLLAMLCFLSNTRNFTHLNSKNKVERLFF